MSVYEALSLMIQSGMGIFALLTFVILIPTFVVALLTYLHIKK